MTPNTGDILICTHKRGKTVIPDYYYYILSDDRYTYNEGKKDFLSSKDIHTLHSYGGFSFVDNDRWLWEKAGEFTTDYLPYEKRVV